MTMSGVLMLCAAFAVLRVKGGASG
jgi:hypothetical protein